MVRLYRRRMELSYRRWRWLRVHHPPKPPTVQVGADGIGTVAHYLPVTDWLFRTGRLRALDTAKVRGVRDLINSRLKLGLGLADELGYQTAPPGAPHREMNVLDMLAARGIAPTDAIVEEGA
jgi:hypothetical protein